MKLFPYAFASYKYHGIVGVMDVTVTMKLPKYICMFVFVFVFVRNIRSYMYMDGFDGFSKHYKKKISSVKSLENPQQWNWCITQSKIERLWFSHRCAVSSNTVKRCVCVCVRRNLCICEKQCCTDVKSLSMYSLLSQCPSTLQCCTLAELMHSLDLNFNRNITDYTHLCFIYQI